MSRLGQRKMSPCMSRYTRKLYRSEAISKYIHHQHQLMNKKYSCALRYFFRENLQWSYTGPPEELTEDMKIYRSPTSMKSWVELHENRILIHLQNCELTVKMIISDKRLLIKFSEDVLRFNSLFEKEERGGRETRNKGGKGRWRTIFQTIGMMAEQSIRLT